MGHSGGRAIEQPGEPCAPLGELLRIDDQPEVAERYRQDLEAIRKAERSDGLDR